METLIVKSQLNFDEYYKLNLRMMWKRLRIFVVLVIVLLLVFYYTNYLSTAEGDTTLMWLSLYFLFIFLLLPLVNIIQARRQFKKIKAMSEPKVYQFGDKGIDIEGITTSVRMDWSNVNRANETKKHIEIGMYNSRSYVMLKRTDFADEQDILKLKDLIKSNGIKNNFKNKTL